MSKYRETGFRVKHRTRHEIRKFAHHLRDFAMSEYGLAGDLFDVVAVIEKWGSLYARGCSKHPDYLVVEDEEMPGRAGEYRPPSNEHGEEQEEHFFLFPRSVWDAASDEEPDARETLAHEIGHCMLQHPRLTYARAYHDERVVWQTDSEWQANVFKDELLMDNRLITKRDGWGDIVRRFGVTKETAIRRLRELRNESRERN